MWLRLLFLILLYPTAQAHGQLNWQWQEPVLPWLGLLSVLYGLGLVRLWSRGGVGQGIKAAQATSFYLGVGVLFMALISPLAPLSHHSFAAHMLQHMLLILVTAPLLALAAPLFVFLWAVPDRMRRALSKALLGRIFTVINSITNPVFALVLFGGMLWLWHLPRLYLWALQHPAIHALEHLSLLASAMLFWWVMLQPLGRRRLNLGLAAMFALVTLLHTSLLGALLTFAPAPLYRVYGGRWLGLDALGDQQLAGLIMWVPMGIVLGWLCTSLLARWLSGFESRIPG